MRNLQPVGLAMVLVPIAWMLFSMGRTRYHEARAYYEERGRDFWKVVRRKTFMAAISTLGSALVLAYVGAAVWFLAGCGFETGCEGMTH